MINSSTNTDQIPDIGAQTLPLGWNNAQATPQSAKQTHTAITGQTGLKGTPLPYRLSSDTGVMILLCCCFLFTVHVLSSGKRFLLQQLKDFFYTGHRSNSWGNSTAEDFRYRLILIGQTVVLLSICSFDFFVEQQEGLIRGISTWKLLGANIGINTAYFLIKWFLYLFIGWIFLDKSRLSTLMESYFVVLSYTGFLFFPFVLLAVYFDISQTNLFLIGIFNLVFVKIILLYKCIKLFFNNLYGLFGLFLYFCALELTPCFIMFKVLSETNNILLIKI